MGQAPPGWAGNSLAAPPRAAAPLISPGVAPPSTKRTWASSAGRRAFGAGKGLTSNAAPASRARAAVRAVVTVPMPVIGRDVARRAR